MPAPSTEKRTSHADPIRDSAVACRPAEIVSGLISLRKKDYVGFGLSVAGLVPLQGEAAAALKLARTAQQIARRGRATKTAQAA